MWRPGAWSQSPPGSAQRSELPWGLGKRDPVKLCVLPSACSLPCRVRP